MSGAIIVLGWDGLGLDLAERAFDVFRAATPPRVWLPVRRAFKTVGVA